MRPPPGTQPFEVDKEYTVILSKGNVLDLSGNALAADYQLEFRTLKSPVEQINPNLSSKNVEAAWMYIVGKLGSQKWVVIWGGMQPGGAPNGPRGTITASPDGRIDDEIESIHANPDVAFSATISKGDGNKLTFSSANLNNIRHHRIIFTSSSKYLTFDLGSASGTVPEKYVQIGNSSVHPSQTPFTLRN